MRTASLSWVLALLISALGIAALPHAELNEHAFHESWASASLLILAAPHLVGLGLGMIVYAGMARLDWARVQQINPWWWLTAAVLVMLLPFAWRGLSDDRLNYWGVDGLIVAMPLLAAWAAGVNAGLGTLGWWRTWLWAGVMALAAVAFMVLPQPFYLLLLLPLLLALAAPHLRRIGGLSFAILAGLLLLGVVSAQYRFQRFLSALFPAIEADPYGAGYQASHIASVLQQLSWFGGDTLTHLPRATTQLLPISLAEQWGGLAFVGVFMLLGLWLVWAHPRKAGEDAVSEHRLVFARLLWFFLVFVVVDNASVNLLLFTPHGLGMPMLSGNWGLLVLAWLLMGANGQGPSGPAWGNGLLLAGAALLAVALLSQFRQPPTTTQNPQVQAIASHALEKTMTQYRAEIGSVVVLDAHSGALLALVSRSSGKHARDQPDFNAVYQHTFAPGHTLSPILAAALMERGLIQPNTKVDTRPLHLKDIRVRDDYPMKGGSTVRDVVAQSSRVGVARMAMMLEPETYLRTLSDLGFATSLGWAHELPGKLESGVNLRSRVILGIAPAGGGIEVNLLQLAQAYLPLAGDGRLHKVFHEAAAYPRGAGKPIFHPDTARKARDLMAGTVSETGTAPGAAVAGIAVGGKTGTIRSPSSVPDQERQTALFVGMAPLDAPRYVVAVMLERELKKGSESMYGGQAAAPVFAEIVRQVMAK